MKRSDPRLKLNKETVKILTQRQILRVVGGVEVYPVTCLPTGCHRYEEE
jgi:hypothetical protein